MGLQDTADERVRLLNPTLDTESGSQNQQDRLPQDDEVTLEGSDSPTPTYVSHQGQWKKNLVLLLGVFLVNSDSAILLAIFRPIASEFNQLSSAGWIINSYLVGIIATQPLYGKLSDIYGRKPLLVFAYCCYCTGSLLAGFGFSFWGVMLGKGIAGVGNAGITVLISTLIVDLVPTEDIAVWRSYVYAVNQIGRAVGPSIGGLIADNLNWRWSLLFPVPFNVFSVLFIWWKVEFPTPRSDNKNLLSEQETPRSKIRRIDFLGTISLGFANCALLLFLEQISRNFDLLHNLFAIISLAISIVFLVAFVLVETTWAREPILPIRLLLTRNVSSTYAIQFFQTAAQMALFTSVPLYFRITSNDSNTLVSIRLFIITVGTILGGLVSGYAIKKTSLHRRVTSISLALSSVSYLAIYLRWRGSTGWLETFYGFPIGLGFGVSLSATFIGLTFELDSTQVAVATSGFYLSLNLGSLFGVSLASLLITTGVKTTLQQRLQGDPNARDILDDVTSNIDKIKLLHGKTKRIVVEAYMGSLINVWLFALICGCVSFLVSFVMREGHRKKKKSNPSESSNYSTVNRT